MKIVLDATPLIYLNKAGLSWIFSEFETFIPPSVFEEVAIKRKEIYKQDALLADKLVTDGKIILEAPELHLEKPIGLLFGEGELQAISLAKQKNAIAIIDDEDARNFARISGLKVHGTFFLLYLMVKNKKLSKTDAVKKMQEMIGFGWRVSVEKYLQFAELINKL